MSEFRFKEKKEEFRIEVKKDREDGSEESRDLVFFISLKDYGFIKTIRDAEKNLAAIESMDSNIGKLDGQYAEEKKLFEMLAPGQWESFFAYLNGNLNDMAYLIKYMAEVVTEKISKAKLGSIAPMVPDGESV
jgi:hypothetical protein